MLKKNRYSGYVVVVIVLVVVFLFAFAVLTILFLLMLMSCNFISPPPTGKSTLVHKFTSVPDTSFHFPIPLFICTLPFAL